MSGKRICCPVQTHNPRIDGFVFDPTNFADSALALLATPRARSVQTSYQQLGHGNFKETPIGEKMRMEFGRKSQHLITHNSMEWMADLPTDLRPAAEGSRPASPFQFALNWFF